jgi:polyhydroxyalkanoate synthesis regulator phasin
MSPGILKEQSEQIKNMFEVANNFNRHLQEQYTNAIPENMKSMFPFNLNGTDAMNPDSNVFSMYMRNVMPVFRFFNPGKEGELKENTVLLLEKMALYNQKAAELQQHIYVTGAKNWEQFLLEGFEQSKKGVDLGNTQEMFQKWVTKNEEAFTELFKSDAYSKLQGELVDLNLEIRQRNEKIAEEMMQSLPVVLRSEADELYTTIYELRKRLHAVEKQLGETENSLEVKDSKSSKKKTATA